MKKNTYRILTIIISTTILVLSANYFQFELKWYYYLILIFIGNIIGNFLFVYFKGVNVSDLQFEGNSDISQKFTFQYQLGFSNLKLLQGVFQNEFNLKEPDLRNILYQQTDRKDLRELELTGEKKVMYSYKNQIFAIIFKN